MDDRFKPNFRAAPQQHEGPQEPRPDPQWIELIRVIRKARNAENIARIADAVAARGAVR